MQNLIVDADGLEQFVTDGFLIVPDLLDGEETELLRGIAKADRVLSESRASRADGEGGSVDLVVSNDLPPDSIYGAIVQSRPLVEAMEMLLGDEVYHYHHKMILKEPRIGGAWTWHQDYGYWYNNGCLFPDMASCMIAVDRATKENGCLQVLSGSHRMGRIDHGQSGDQTGADPDRIQAAVKEFELLHVELDPGSAVIFHSNTLHRSDQNRSERPRWAFICCYNTRHNSPYREGRHPLYSPLDRVDASQIVETGRRHLSRVMDAAGNHV